MTSGDERADDLVDVALRDEIELVSDLVVAASTSPRHFTQDEVDVLLGVGEGDPAGDESPGDDEPTGPEPIAPDAP